MRRQGIIRIGPFPFRICLVLVPMLLTGCSHWNEARQAQKTFAEANELFQHGSYTASLDKYSEITEKYPAQADRALFEMGIINAHPRNGQKDYPKSLECFQKLIKEFPESDYRQNSEMMIFNIRNVVLKDQTIAGQQMRIESLGQEIQGKENEIAALQKKIEAFEKNIEALEKKFSDYAIRKGTADRILIEKSARRLV